MQVLNKQAFDLMVFSGVHKVPFGENVKDFYLNDFKNSPESWDKFFKDGEWSSLDEVSRKERESIIKQELAKLDVNRKTFDL